MGATWEPRPEDIEPIIASTEDGHGLGEGRELDPELTGGELLHRASRPGATSPASSCSRPTEFHRRINGLTRAAAMTMLLYDMSLDGMPQR